MCSVQSIYQVCPACLPCPSCPSSPQPVIAPSGNSVGCSLQQILDGYDDLYEREALFRKQKFLCVTMMQDPNDAQVISEILFDVKPDLIIETGTNNGGSALYWAAHLSKFMENFRIVTMDVVTIDQIIAEIPSDDPRKNKLFQDHVVCILRSSTAAETIAEIEGHVSRASRVLVLLDSNHDYWHVLQEMDLYHKYVSKGSYMIVEDTKLDRLLKAPGPMKAAQDWIAANQHLDFVVDKGREYLYYTQHKNGFLKKL